MICKRIRNKHEINNINICTNQSTNKMITIDCSFEINCGAIEFVAQIKLVFIQISISFIKLRRFININNIKQNLKNYKIY